MSCWPFGRTHRKVLSLTGQERSIENVRREIRAIRQIIEFERGGLYRVLQKVLNPYRFAEVETGITKFGSSFVDVIQATMMYPKEGRPAVAPDPDAFRTFRHFFDALFLHLHGFESKTVQMPIYYGNFAQISHLDPTQEYVIRIRVECSRNLKGFPFLPRMTRDDLLAVESKVKEALTQLEEKHRGAYESQTNPPLKENLRPELAAWSYYPNIRRFDEGANLLHDWPIGRGIHSNPKKTFVVWVNHEDHLRVIIRQPNPNLHAAYTQLYDGMTKFDELLEIASDRRIGRLTVDPQRIGNGLRIYAHLHLPQLSRYTKTRRAIVQELGLGEARPPSERGEEFIYSYRTSLGCSEYESFAIFQAGIEKILDAEMRLEETKLENEAIVGVAIKTMEDYVAGVGDLTALEESGILDPEKEVKEEKEEKQGVSLSLQHQPKRRKRLFKKLMKK